MTKQGHIEIQDKVVFVYYELPKPEYEYFVKMRYSLPSEEYKKAMKEYNASKREVEVENVVWGELCELWMFECENPLDELEGGIEVKHNQKCEAEIINNKAVITKINV